MTTQTDYSRLLQERRARSTVIFVNGYPIRRTQTRFGDVYAVIGTNGAFATLAHAEAHARKLAGGRASPGCRPKRQRSAWPTSPRPT